MKSETHIQIVRNLRCHNAQPDGYASLSQMPISVIQSNIAFAQKMLNTCGDRPEAAKNFRLCIADWKAAIGNRLSFARNLASMIENGDAIIGSTPKSRADLARLRGEIAQMEQEA